MTHRLDHRSLPRSIWIGLALLCVAAGTHCNLTSPAEEKTSVADAPGVGSPTLLAEKPEPPPQSLFYPLQLGNRWDYARTFTAQISPDGGEPESPITTEATIESEITGTEELFGRAYWVQENRWNEEGEEFTEWVRFRQDRRGLYEADVPLQQPPASRAEPPSNGGRRAVRVAAAAPSGNAIRQRLAHVHPAYVVALEKILARRHALHAALRATQSGPRITAPPGGAEDRELVRLQYPLRPGARWTVVADPLIESTVEGREELQLPIGRRVATRIRIHSEILGPNDRAAAWVDRCGELKFEFHFEGEATNEDGERIGDVVADEVMVVTGIEVSRGGCAR
ncbi:MAG: hypothetical protein JSW67_09690 [Candidatus Latescibacterota bacterium]|nr:MAG: hypothetical protein JSW67_09690 [Candidatus Latescibacterota bacterium]